MRLTLKIAAGSLWAFLGVITLARPSVDSNHFREEQVIGFYSRGDLINAQTLVAEGPGFVRLFLPRNRGWGSYELNQIISSAAEELSQRFPYGERVQIGDLSAERGGYISGHSSHQNGLDADIAWLRKSYEEQDPQDTGGFHESFVRSGRVTSNFDVERNWEFLKLLVAKGNVVRIFVDGVIKKEFCRYARSQGEYESDHEVLRKLRPLRNHADHLHLRIECPESSPRCVPQQPVQPGSGC